MPSLSQEDLELAGHYFKELENPPKPLTAHELGAVENWDDAYSHGRLTDTQFEKLKTLYRRKCQ